MVLNFSEAFVVSTYSALIFRLHPRFISDHILKPAKLQYKSFINLIYAETISYYLTYTLILYFVFILYDVANNIYSIK